MTVVALDYMAQLAAHMAAAVSAAGDAIVKGDAFYGGHFQKDSVREHCLREARSHDLHAQFTRSHGQWSLRLSARKDGHRK